MKSLLLVSLAIFVLLIDGTNGQVEGEACTNSTSVLFKDPGNDCSLYFRCVESNWLGYRCASGLVYDTTTTTCIFPDQTSECKEFAPINAVGLLKKIDQSNQCVLPCPVSAPIMYPKMTAANIDCSGFYLCVGGDLYEGKCTDVGSKFTVYDLVFRSCSQRNDAYNPNCGQQGQGRRKKRSPFWRSWSD